MREESAARGRSTVLVLAIAAVFAGLGTASTTPAGSLLITEITGTESLAGLTQTCGLVGAAIAAAVLARVTTARGRRTALALGYSIAVLGTLLALVAAVISSAFLLLVAALLVGWAVAAALQARFAAVDDADDTNRSTRLSFVVWGSTVGAVTGPNLMEPAGRLAQHLSLPALAGPYVLAAVTLFIAAAVIGVGLRKIPKPEASSTAPRQPLLTTLGHINRNPHARLGLWAIIIGHIAMVSIMVMTPVHMKHEHMGLTVIGFVISIHVAGMYAFSPLVGAAARRWGSRVVIVGGVITLLAAAAVAGSAAPMDAMQLEIGLFLLGLGWSMTLIGGSTLLAGSVTAELQVSVQGASDVLMSAGGALFGALAGVVIATLGYSWLCAFASPLILAVGFLAFQSKSAEHSTQGVSA